ncbi:hypothetical protein N7456_011085 [Penicillium angulare]|uniref:Uncharacterized protein n=1 Tax=Penicillium angulare TaxID=116970 RepID=A0A9W9ETA8_9EURO|nr:hypothetical protein N7456_011085 [Penicillium angulare]
MAPKKRGNAFPKVFDTNGDIRADRTPMDPAPLALAHGLPFFFMYRGYYVLCGNRHAHLMGLHQIRQKVHLKKTPDYPVFSIGAVVAPRSFLSQKRSVIRQFYSWTSANASFPIECESDGGYDIMGTDHTQGTLYWTGRKLAIQRLFRVKGYNVRCGPGDAALVDIAPADLFKGTDFDYNLSLKKPYDGPFVGRSDASKSPKKDTPPPWESLASMEPVNQNVKQMVIDNYAQHAEDCLHALEGTQWCLISIHQKIIILGSKWRYLRWMNSIID